MQAVIYDLRTGAALATVELSQSSNNAHLFTATIQAPPDSTGIGRSIVAVASVYTDSDYGTKSTDYEEQEQYFLVKPQIIIPPLDYGAIRDMVREESRAAIAAIPPPPPAPEYPFDALFGAIGALQREINRVPKEIDTSALSASIADVRKAVDAIPPPEKLDLSRVMGFLSNLASDIAALRTHIQRVGAGVVSAQQAAFKGVAPELLARVESGITDLMSKQELTIPLSKLVAPKQTPAPGVAEVRHLMKK